MQQAGKVKMFDIAIQKTDEDSQLLKLAEVQKQPDGECFIHPYHQQIILAVKGKLLG